jgi:class 3 adenylate cyclase/tetratricopeptide (TPR) repeat protein
MSSDRAQLEQAITALEAQRGILGDAVVETAVAPLKEKLAALIGPAQSSTEQRKLVTVLFADVTGFTAMSETLDAEDVKEIMDLVWRRLDATVIEYGGVIDKHIGDAVMALWGVEATREDDAEQAISAALGMQTALAEFSDPQRSTGRPVLKMRIGINTGLALLGEVGTTGEFTAMGDTVNVASRLQNAAPPGRVIISNDTYRHVRGVFDVDVLEPIEVKGKSEPLQVYLVNTLKPRAFRIGTRGVEGVETRMVGRDTELTQLQELFQEIIEEQYSQVMTVVGDAGVGKSRLLHEINKWIELHPEPAWMFKGRSAEHTSSVPFSLMRDMLAFRFEIQENEEAAVAKGKLVDQIRTFMGQGTEEKAHFIGHLIGYDFSTSPYLRGVLADTQQIRTRAFHYMAQFFRAVSGIEARPIVVTLEDLHWADDGSLELIRHLVEDCRDTPILFLCMARPTLYERHPDWTQEDVYFHRINLVPLTRDQASALVDDILQNVDNVPEVLRELITSRAEGNPYYVEELIKMLIDDGVIIKGAEKWLVEPGRLVEARIPQTLTGVIQARLDGLASEEKETLQRASIIGRVFWDRTVAYLGRETIEQTQKVLSSLVEHELIFERESSAFAGAKEYIFKHAILHEVTYESVLKKLRGSYHGLAAEWLELQRGERRTEMSGLIADHYEKSGDVGKALEYLNQSGEQALKISAYRDAVGSFERALALASGPQSERLLNAQRWQARLKNQLGIVYRDLGDYPSAQTHLVDSLELSREINDKTGIAQALRLLGDLDHRRGDYSAVMNLLGESLELYKEAYDDEGTIDALTDMGDVSFSIGDIENGLRALEEALSLAREIGDKRRTAGALQRLGFLSWNGGDFELTLERLNEALRIYKDMGDRNGISTVHNTMGGAFYTAGKMAEARQHYKDSLKIAEEIGDRSAISRALANLGEVAYDMGDYLEAEKTTRDALKVSYEIGTTPRVLYTLFGMARLKAHEGKKEQAVQWMTLALTHPAVRNDLRVSSESFMKELQKALSPDQYEQAEALGRTLDLDAVVAELLSAKRK